jgi:hypothetical protein
MLIVIVVINKLEIHQIDVQTAFLNDDLNEKVYTEQHEGFVINKQKNKVFKLVR